MNFNQGTGLIVVSLFLLIGLTWIVHFLLKKRGGKFTQAYKHWVLALVIIVGLLIIFAILPINSQAKDNVFSLLGILLTVVVAISSTTFVSNAMAGLMLKTIKHLAIGDFLEVKEYFGRVSEMGLLHTEIQNKLGNYTTLPNLYLVVNPVTVIPSDKALIDATISLGYDVSHHQVSEVLIEAAKKIDLQEPFVQITELGDYSVSYRVAGFLTNPKLLLSVRSNLRKQMIDSLHKSGIEIVSPSFVNQRIYSKDTQFISEFSHQKEQENKKAQKSAVFDKAEMAESAEAIEKRLKALEEVKKNTDNSLGDQEKTHLKARLESQLAQLKEKLDDGKE